ncbi:ribosome-associated translation inhibitor RaiA [Ectothiorhodospiraceae bacterium BW-2]|nr:ribosome-associated translation inhibitor RaiA [Ectothiorhodospiraceae bacterium BW-2]
MQLNLTGHHVEITDPLREYVGSKLERLERHFDQVTNAHVILSVEKQRQKAEATINITGNQLFANHEHEDMYAAIDGLADKLDRQIRKHKEKVTNHHRNNGALKDQPLSE